MLIVTTTITAFADGETHTGGRSIIEIIYDVFGNIIGYIYG